MPDKAAVRKQLAPDIEVFAAMFPEHPQSKAYLALPQMLEWAWPNGITTIEAEVGDLVSWTGKMYRIAFINQRDVGTTMLLTYAD